MDIYHTTINNTKWHLKSYQIADDVNFSLFIAKKIKSLITSRYNEKLIHQLF